MSKRNSIPLRLHVPEPAARPGMAADFAGLPLSQPGAVRRPPTDTEPAAIVDLAGQLIRVLDSEGTPCGPWAPDLAPDMLIRGLRSMMITRAYDERMVRMQRQGKTSFYMKSTGEEAVAAAGAMALDRDDMFFPTVLSV
jgi:2-oxoisovalerate dehydrogenase E1 component alpha subunit